jgi:hypothetical protein
MTSCKGSATSLSGAGSTRANASFLGSAAQAYLSLVKTMIVPPGVIDTYINNSGGNRTSTKIKNNQKGKGISEYINLYITSAYLESTYNITKVS